MFASATVPGHILVLASFTLFAVKTLGQIYCLNHQVQAPKLADRCANVFFVFVWGFFSLYMYAHKIPTWPHATTH